MELAFREAQSQGRCLSLLMLDLDGFKGVNGQFGQRTGDLLLRSVARRMEGVVPEGAVVARTGSDTFAVLVSPVSGEDEAMEIADRLAATLAIQDRLDERILTFSSGMKRTISIAWALLHDPALAPASVATVKLTGRTYGTRPL